MLRYETNILTLEKCDFSSPRMLVDLARALCQGLGYTPVRFAWFLDISTNTEYNMWRGCISEAMKVMGGCCPAWSIVAQPPLGKVGICLEVHSIETAPGDRISFHRDGIIHYVLVEGKSGKHMFADSMSESLLRTSDVQAETIFSRIGKILKRNGFETDMIYRQWNYVEGIVDFSEDGRQHYQMLNDARSEFYSKAKWNGGYPSATGIGTQAGGIVVWVNASTGNETRAIDNPLQIAAHAYSASKMQNGGQNERTTPKFERARESSSPEMMFISGTAAIRGEESSVSEDASEQTRMTIENIDALIAQATRPIKVRTARVYVKHDDDFRSIAELCEKAYNVADIMYVKADICRPELLVEIEAIAY